MEGVVSADILEEEILPRVVEVKTLLRLRCVSKSWRSWIDSKRFINELQPQHSSRRLRRRKFITHLSDASDDKEFPITKPSTYSIVVGHHKGLLCNCMLNVAEPSQFFIWNPASRIYTRLPLLEGEFDYNETVKLGFGWDEEADAYKVFVGIPRRDHGHEEVKIYSSKIKSWTTMVVEHTFLRYTYLGVGVFVCGKIYWLTESGKIVSFDLSSGVFGATMIKPPRKFAWRRMWLCETEGRLCFLRNDYGARTVWAIDTSNPTVWVKQEQLTSRFGLYTGFNIGFRVVLSYFETLLSPALFVHNN